MKNLFTFQDSTYRIFRRMIRIFLPAALLICGCAFLIHQTEVHQQHTRQASEEQEAIRAGTVSINRTLQEVGHDLLYLAGRIRGESVQEINSAPYLDRIARDWAVFSQANVIYNKLRWFDETGMERLRIDYATPEPKIIPKEKLQYKGDRYFFIEISKLGRNEIFVSPLDLNVDNKQIEIPYHPNIRFGMQLFDKNNQSHGILLINYSAHNLLKRFVNETGSRNTNQHWLVNEDGYWLKGPTAEDEFGFMFGRKNLTMAERYPQVWEKIISESHGQFETPEGLWTFATVYPLQDWQKDRAGQPNGKNNATPLTTQVSKNSRYAWKSISLLPAEQYNAGLTSFRLKLGGGTLILLLLFFAGTWRLSYVAEARERIQNELGVATQIQASLLPSLFPAFPQRPEFDIYASMNPAKEVGGDFYDFFFVDESHLCFLIADVSDKGVPAALYMMVVKTLLKSEGIKLREPAHILESVNNTVARDNDSCMFATVLCAILDTRTGEVSMASAGHNPPILIHKNEVQYLHPAAGLVLGPMENITYTTETCTLSPGDTLFFYTDGVTEAQNQETRLYGEKRLQNALARWTDCTPEEMIRQIREDVFLYANGTPQSDDITMLALTWRGTKLLGKENKMKEMA